MPTTTGYASLHLMMLHVHRVWLFQPVCARNLCHWLMRHILISKVVCGGFENDVKYILNVFFWCRIASDVKENVFKCEV